MSDHWFTYPPFDSEDFLARVLGRPRQGREAVLKEYSLLPAQGYPHLVAQVGSQVQGLLMQLRLGDDWLLDDEFGVAQGYYRRQRVEIETEDGAVEAWTMVGGPSLSWALQEETASVLHPSAQALPTENQRES